MKHRPVQGFLLYSKYPTDELFTACWTANILKLVHCSPLLDLRAGFFKCYNDLCIGGYPVYRAGGGGFCQSVINVK